MFQTAFLVFISLAWLSSGYCADFYSDPQSGKEGWYGYQLYEQEDNEEAEVQEAQKPEIYVWPALEEVKKLGAKALGELIDRATDVAVGNPTEANVLRWVQYMDIAREKSKNFANVAAWVKQNHPEFNTVIQSPYNYSGRQVAAKARLAAMKEYIKNRARKIAILLFVADTAPLSTPAKKILKDFCQKRGIPLKIYDVGTDYGQILAQSIGVNAVPQAWVISKEGYRPFPVMTGSASKNQIEAALYRGLRIVSGKTDPQKYADPLPITMLSKGVE